MPRILVCHESGEQREEIALSLRELGYEQIAGAPDGSQALSRLARGDVDLVVADVQLRHVDGIELCRLMRSPGFSQLNHTPVLLLSGSVSADGLVEIAREAGADHLLLWPSEGSSLATAVDRALSKGMSPPPDVRILVADDDADITKVIALRLRQDGFEVVTATDGLKAIRVAEAFRPDIVLSDYAMPGASGLEVLSWCVRHLPEAAFIMLTARGSERLAADAFNEGAADYLSKPLRLGTLAQTCRAALRRSRRLATSSGTIEALLGQVRRSESRYRALFEHAGDAILVIDFSGRIRRINRAAARLLGESHHLIGKHCEDIFEGEHLHRIGPFFTRVYSGGSLHLSEVAIHRPDGRPVYVDLSASPFEVEEDRSMVLILRDVTERRRIESELRQLQKMEAIGRLAGGIAHDFGNLLTVIRAETEVIHRDYDGGADFKDCVDTIHEAASRATELTRALMAFSRRQPLSPQTLDLRDLIESRRMMIQRLIGSSITLRIVESEEPCYVRVDPTQVTQILLNLAVNARDAMLEGGDLVLDAHPGDLPPSLGPGSEISPLGWIVLSVSDSGCGIPTEIAGKIFEPFFTTKDRSHGTGLGLATVYGIVQQSGGRIDVESVVGEGTTIRIYLPSAHPAQS